MQWKSGCCLLLLLLCLAPGSGLGADRKSSPDTEHSGAGESVTTAERRDDERGHAVLPPAAPEPSIEREAGPTDPTGVRNRLNRQRQQQQHGEEGGNSGEGQQLRHRL